MQFCTLSQLYIQFFVACWSDNEKYWSKYSLVHFETLIIKKINQKKSKLFINSIKQEKSDYFKLAKWLTEIFFQRVKILT